MENFKNLRKRITNVLSWRSESKTKKEIIKNITIETEKAEAEKLYWLMNSCLEFAENIQENLQISTENPVILNDTKFWIETQVQMIKALWWPRRNQYLLGTFWLSNAYTPYILENLSESSLSAIKSWAEFVHYTNRKFTEFRCSRPQVPRRRSIFKRYLCCCSE